MLRNLESNLSRQRNLTFPALKSSIGRLASEAVSSGPIKPGQSNGINPPQSNLSRQTKSRTVPPSHQKTMAVTMDPDTGGASTSSAPLLQALPTNPEVAGTSTSVATIEAPPRKKAESAFLEKNSSIKSLTVLTIGIKDDNGAALIDLDAEPWTCLVSTTSRPQRDDLAEEVLCRYVSENLSDRQI